MTTRVTRTAAAVCLLAATITGCAAQDISGHSDALSDAHSASESTANAQTASGNTGYAILTRVTDGDTVRAHVLTASEASIMDSPEDAQREAAQRFAHEKDTTAIRLLGINAPEVSHGSKKGQCGGTQATNHLRELAVPGTVLTITTDPQTPATDRYGRTLSYVSASGRDLSRAMLDAGYAQAYSPKSQKAPVRLDDYQHAEHASHEARAGAWGQCGTITKAAPGS